MSDLDTAEIRRCLDAGMSPLAGHGQLVPDLLDEVDRLRARLGETEGERDGLKALLDSSILKGQGYCGARHWNGGTCFHPAGHPKGHPEHYGDADTLRADLAAAQAQRDSLSCDVTDLANKHAKVLDERDEALARLAAVETWCGPDRTLVFSQNVRAAARGVVVAP